MKDTKRAKRRHHYYRMKARFLKYWKNHNFGRWTGEAYEGPSNEWLGNMVSTHGCPCSCAMGCGNARAAYGPSMAEKKQAGYYFEA